MKNLSVLITFVLLVGMGTATNATTITFDEFEQSGFGSTFMLSYSFDGFEIINESGMGGGFHSIEQDNPQYKASASLYNSIPDGWTNLSRTDGNIFTVHSIDVVRSNLFGSAPVKFYGYNANNLQVASTETLTLDSDVWQTVTFDSTFYGIAYLRWQQVVEFHQFDNIELNAIPESTTMLLLGAGLLGLAVTRRKMKK